MRAAIVCLSTSDSTWSALTSTAGTGAEDEDEAVAAEGGDEDEDEAVAAEHVHQSAAAEHEHEAAAAEGEDMMLLFSCFLFLDWET